MVSVDDALDSELPRHKKRRKSSTSDAKRKSKHKHEYVDCVLIKKDGEHIESAYKGTYCTICGKIGKINFFESRKEGCLHTLLSTNEILEKYQKLETKRIEHILYDKYVLPDNESKEEYKE